MFNIVKDLKRRYMVHRMLKLWRPFNQDIKYDKRLGVYTDWSDEKLSKIPSNREMIISEGDVKVRVRLKGKTLIGSGCLVEIIEVVD